MLLECGCGKMYRVRDGAANPPKNCPSCGGPLRQSGGGAAPAPAAPAAAPAADPRVKELEARVQAFEREQGAAKAAVELKEKELHEAQSSIARLGADLEKAQMAYKEALLKKDAELAERAAQATKLILAKDEALTEAREKIESLESKGGGSDQEQELAESRQGKERMAEEFANSEATYKAALNKKESEVDELQKRAQDLEKQLAAATPKASTPEGQRFQARIASLERIVQDGEQRYRALQKELDKAQGGAPPEAADEPKVSEADLEERDARIGELETRIRELEESLAEAKDEAEQARAKTAGAVTAAPSDVATTRLGEVRYLSADLDRGLASISTALGGLVSRVRRLNETLADIPAVPVAKSSSTYKAVPAAAPPPPSSEESEPEEPPPVEPDAPPDLPTTEAEDATPVEAIPALETFEVPDEAPSSLPADETLLDMGGREKPSAEEAEPAEPAEEDVAELPEEEGKPKKGFFGKLFGGKKKR